MARKGMRRSDHAMRGKARMPMPSAMEYVKSVDQMPSTPARASNRYGYQTMPHVAAPKRSAQAGAESGSFKRCTFYNRACPNCPSPASVSFREHAARSGSVSYTHLRAHETPEHLVCRLLLEKK